MKVNTSSYALIAAVAYGFFAAIGLAVWYPLLFVAVPSGTSTSRLIRDLLSFEPGGLLLGLHTTASIAAAIFAIILLIVPLATRRASLVAVGVSGLFAAAVWGLYQSDAALLPTIGAGVLAWHYFKPQVPHREA